MVISFQLTIALWHNTCQVAQGMLLLVQASITVYGNIPGFTSNVPHQRCAD